ncbi:SMP-30/gluconolactonase/LRE family protein [Curvibacter sp. HBC61]|uniref:SMP-30/gluconolactonase/LRE family protein n=1 Tax=Curvibacter cyanobacteriorum TaxID=3026422 RepID=A0ABT5MXL8_9BURK|nr:SMP-30/gluconolactonase/LRE family protein [Curvibacter sp. HBC61]
MTPLAWADTLLTYAGSLIPNGLATNIGAGASGMAVDAAGLLYVTDISNHTVRRIDPATGQSTVIAGAGRSGFSGDGGAATDAMLNAPRGVAVDSAGNVYIADTGNHRIRKINTSGVISTFAGTGATTFAGDGNAATAANFSGPQGVAVDGAGNVFIADTGNHRVRQVSVGGTVTTVAGIGQSGYLGDDVAATTTSLSSPRGVVLDGTGAFYIVDASNQRIRKVSTAGIITTVAGTGTAGFTGDGGAATSASLRAPAGLALDGSGNLYISDSSNHRIRKVSAGVITTLAGTGTFGFGGDGGAPASAQINSPQGVAVDSTGTVYVADTNNVRVRKISGGLISTLAGTGSNSFGGDGSDALSAQFSTIQGVARDSAGNVYISDSGSHRIRKISPTGLASTLAGTGVGNYSGDNGPASSAQLKSPQGIALDSAGNLYVADSSNHRIRKIDTSGTITTVAGSGSSGFSGDGGPANSAQLDTPYGVLVDSQGNIFIVDSGNNRIRQVDTAGTITTLAGSGGTGLVNGAAASAKFTLPIGLSIDSAGSLYVADFGNNVIRKVAAGMVSTVVGTGSNGFSGDGDAATSAKLNFPRGTVVDAANNLYIADTGNHRIRKVDSNGVITTVAGSGTPGFSGDGGAPTSAQLSSPFGLSLFGSMGLLIVDNGNRRVRLLAFADPPGAPTSVTATAGNASATVSFAAPAADGGSAITGYTVVSSPAGGTDSNAGSTGLSHAITGLTNGVSYTFTVVASNLAGSGPASSPSNSVVPGAAHGACGAAANVSSLFMPSSNLCSAGSASAVSNSSPWRWNCVGSNGGSTAMCSAPVGQTVSGTGASRVSVAGSNWVVDQVGTTNGQPNTAGAIRVTGDAKSPPDPAPAGYVFAHGLYDFTLTGGTGPATVVINYPTALPAGTVYWKYGKTSPAGAARWYIFPGAVISEDRLSITLTLSDGALGDDDGTVNGVITDPGGPGVPLNAATAVPALSPWALATLGLLLMLMTCGLRGAGVSRSADVAGR